MLLQKYSKMQHIFAYNGLPWGATAHDLHFKKALVELMLIDK